VLLAGSPVKVADDEDPTSVVPPGIATTVQSVDGKPLNNTEPVAVVQVG